MNEYTLGMRAISRHPKHFLLVSDFDQTLSFNDSGMVLSERLGVSGFQQKVEGLARSNLVQQGAELAYLLRHDPSFRGVRREHLVEAGRRVRLRSDIAVLKSFLDRHRRAPVLVLRRFGGTERGHTLCAERHPAAGWYTAC